MRHDEQHTNTSLAHSLPHCTPRLPSLFLSPLRKSQHFPTVKEQLLLYQEITDDCSLEIHTATSLRWKHRVSATKQYEAPFNFDHFHPRTE